MWREEEMEEENMKSKGFGRIDKFQLFGDNLSYEDQIEMIYNSYETSKSGSHIFIAKCSNY